MPTNRAIIIQQSNGGDVMVPIPYPIVVDALDGSVQAGRPDAHALIGFQNDPDIQHIDIPFLHILPESLDKAVGKYPVFSNANGKTGLFVLRLPIESIHYFGAPLTH